jgi:hypothetical protein
MTNFSPIREFEISYFQGLTIGIVIARVWGVPTAARAWERGIRSSRLIRTNRTLPPIRSDQFDGMYAVTTPDLTQKVEAIPGEVARIRISDSFFERGQMLKIQKSSNGQVVFTLSGQMDEQHIAELETYIRSEANRRSVVLDLKDLTPVGRDAISFLERCEADGVTLKNCATYVREWITRQRLGR